jgi:hypothetical protein
VGARQSSDFGPDGSDARVRSVWPQALRVTLGEGEKKMQDFRWSGGSESRVHVAVPAGPLLQSSERSIQTDKRDEHVRLRLRGTALGLQLRSLGVEEREEVGDPLSVPGTRKV